MAERVLFDVSPVQNNGPWIEHHGRPFLQFSTNDYLGLSIHPEVKAVAAETAARYGISAPMGARPLTGTCELHLELERKVAEFKQTEAAITFTMGAGAMMGALGCLARPGDLMIMDQLAHASLVAGAKIGGASIKYFKHNDVASLERVLRQANPDVAKLVVVDGVYSMNGDIAPLVEICDLKDKYGARLMVDDAHGNGVCGPHGGGVAEMLGAMDRVDIHAGTFSKAIGTSGGFIASNKDVVFFIRCLAPTLLFTKAMSAVVTAATTKALELMRKADDRRAAMWANAHLIQRLLGERGIAIGETRTPITPIHFEGNTALFVADILRRKFDIFISAVVYPAVRRGSAILRCVPTAMHKPENIAYLVESLSAALEELKGSGRLGSADPGSTAGPDHRRAASGL